MTREGAPKGANAAMLDAHDDSAVRPCACGATIATDAPSYEWQCSSCRRRSNPTLGDAEADWRRQSDQAERDRLRREREERARRLAAQLHDPELVDDPRGAVVAMLEDALGEPDGAAWANAARQAREYRPSVEPFEGPILSAEEVERLLDRPSLGTVRRWRENAPKGPRYAMAALEGEADQVAHASEGVRNETLNRSAWTLGRLVADGLLAASEVEVVLVGAAQDAGLHPREARATVRGALRRRGCLR